MTSSYIFPPGAVRIFLVNIPGLRRHSWNPLRRQDICLLKRIVLLPHLDEQAANSVQGPGAIRCTRACRCAMAVRASLLSFCDEWTQP